jgi:protein ImuB
MRSGKRQLPLFSGVGLQSHAQARRAQASHKDDKDQGTKRQEQEGASLAGRQDLQAEGLVHPEQAVQREETRPGKGELRTAIIKTRKLWLCLHFPSLALVALRADRQAHLGDPNQRADASQPVVVIEDQHQQSQIVALTDAAAAAGIATGMSLNAALAFCPELEVLPRDTSAEQQLLNRLAQWALSFTPVVTCVDQGVLLEVHGSLRLFGGLNALLQRLKQALQAKAYPVRMAYAPTPRAALWLAVAHDSEASVPGCATLDHLHPLLAGLPLHSLRWPKKVQQRLERMGVHTLGDCLRLPRDGFARRIGRAYLREMDQASGRQPDMPSVYEPPVRFQAALELDAGTTDTRDISQVVPLCQELLARLSALMRQRQKGIRELHFELLHYRHPATPIVIASRGTHLQVDYLFELLRLRLDYLQLKHSVTGVRLLARLHECAEPTDIDLALFPGGDGDDGAHDYLLQKLRIRLGSGQVYFICQVADHRPEYAWCIVVQPGAAQYHCGSLMAADMPGELVHRPRPLWLFEQPRRLSQSCGLPQYYGPLTFVTGAERIEGGWWDGDDIRRDYYAVIRRNGERVWVFRDCRNAAWYLHGIFA